MTNASIIYDSINLNENIINTKTNAYNINTYNSHDKNGIQTENLDNMDKKDPKRLSQNEFNMKSLFPEITGNSRRTESIFQNSTNKILFDENIPLRDQIFNKMHKYPSKVKGDNYSIIENNKKIKYVMYKNSEKSIAKGDLLYDDFMRSPRSFRSKSMYGILKTNQDFIKYRNDEKELRRKLNIH